MNELDPDPYTLPPTFSTLHPNPLHPSLDVYLNGWFWSQKYRAHSEAYTQIGP